MKAWKSDYFSSVVMIRRRSSELHLVVGEVSLSHLVGRNQTLSPAGGGHLQQGCWLNTTHHAGHPKMEEEEEEEAVKKARSKTDSKQNNPRQMQI